MKIANLVRATLVLAFVFAFAGCAPAPTPPPAAPTAVPATAAPTAKVWHYEDMTVGFLQTGSEGGWRAANTASFKETAEQLGLNAQVL